MTFSQKFLACPKGYLVTLAEQRAENGDGEEEQTGKSILHICSKKDCSVSAKLFPSIKCKCIRLGPVSCNGIVSPTPSQNRKIIQKRNYANKIISHHHCLQRRTTKSCSQENLLIRIIMLLGFLSHLFVHTVISA